mgnify:CR=1 FL=1
MSGLIYRLSFFLLLVFSPSVAFGSHCLVTQISVIPGPWDNAFSKTSLTLQTQDLYGEPCHLTQTLRFSITKSASGEFTTQSGGNLQYFVSSGSANRNFYYSNHPENFSLDIEAGYGNSTDWEPTFSFTYKNIAEGSAVESSATFNSTTTEESVFVTDSSKTDDGSAHHHASPITYATNSIQQIGAGRNRISVSGSPIEFLAEGDFSRSARLMVQWNFGDGSQGFGSSVVHTYEYPGDYLVVLNATSQNNQAVSKTKVKVIEPDFKISLADDKRIELVNLSPYELNLYGRAIVVGDSYFVFPKDTIASPGSSISFPSGVTRLKASGVESVLVVVLGQVESPDIPNKVLEAKLNRISEIKKEIVKLQEEYSKFCYTTCVKNDITKKEESIVLQTSNDYVAAPASSKSKGGFWFDIKKFLFRNE